MKIPEGSATGIFDDPNCKEWNIRLNNLSDASGSFSSLAASPVNRLQSVNLPTLSISVKKAQVISQDVQGSGLA